MPTTCPRWLLGHCSWNSPLQNSDCPKYLHLCLWCFYTFPSILALNLRIWKPRPRCWRSVSLPHRPQQPRQEKLLALLRNSHETPVCDDMSDFCLGETNCGITICLLFAFILLIYIWFLTTWPAKLLTLGSSGLFFRHQVTYTRQHSTVISSLFLSLQKFCNCCLPCLRNND